METTRIQNGKTERIEAFFVNSSNAGITGATPSLLIRRKSDGYFWNGTAFQFTTTTVNMNEVDASGDAGKYYYSFNTAGLNDDDYFITASLGSAINSPQFGELKVGGYVNYIDAAISNIHLSVPMFAQGIVSSGKDSVWTKEEKDEIIRNVREILGKVTILKTADSEQISVAQEAIKNKIEEVSVEMIAIVLKEFQGIVEKHTEGLLDLKRFLHTHSETSLQANEAVKSEIVKQLNEKLEALPKLDSVDVLKELSGKLALIEKLVVAQTPTETLEDINNDNGSK